MKKVSVLAALGGIVLSGAASAANITVYHSPTCPHCHHAREFINNTLIYEYPTVTVTEVNVMEQGNLDAFRGALEKCKYESGGVPVIVIGDKCMQGYADFMQQEIRDAVEADMSDDAKATAAENKKALEANPEQFKQDNAQRSAAVVEYIAGADQNAQPAAAQDNTENVTTEKSNVNPMWLYGILGAALVIALVVILASKRKGNK